MIKVPNNSTERAAVFCENMADIGRGAIAAVRNNLYNKLALRRTKALVEQFFKRFTAISARTALNGPFNIVFRHIDGSGAVNRLRQGEIHGRIAAFAGGNSY